MLVHCRRLFEAAAPALGLDVFAALVRQIIKLTIDLPGSAKSAGHRGARNRRHKIVCAIAFLIFKIPPLAYAGGAEPDLMQILIGEDVTLNNNLIPLAAVWETGPEGRFLDLGFGAEKQLSARMGGTITAHYDVASPYQTHESTNFGNVEFQLKYLLPDLPERGLALALTSGLSIPTSSHLGNEPTYARAELGLSWGGRLGHSSNYAILRYLRALEFQGDIGYTRTFDSKGSSGFFLDPVVDYSMPYLDYTTRGGVPAALRYFCPFIELNLYHSVGSGSGPRSAAFFMPGLALMTETFQVSAGTQIALNHETARTTQLTVVASILVFLDAIDRRFAWLPF